MAAHFGHNTIETTNNNNNNNTANLIGMWHAQSMFKIGQCKWRCARKRILSTHYMLKFQLFLIECLYYRLAFDMPPQENCCNSNCSTHSVRLLFSVNIQLVRYLWANHKLICPFCTRLISMRVPSFFISLFILWKRISNQAFVHLVQRFCSRIKSAYRAICNIIDN